MRILVVVHGFPPYAHGGAEMYAGQHATALVRLFGDDVHVLTREQRADRPEYSIRREQRQGLTITWINNTFREVRSYEESYRNPQIARIAARVIDEFRPDVAHLHHLTCLSTEIPRLLTARGVPALMTLHDYWLQCHRGQLLDLNYRLCPGREPAGCRHCLGEAALAVSPGLVPALRRVEQHLPGAITSKGRRLAARLSTLAAGGVRDDSASRRRLEHMHGVCGEISRFLAPARDVRDRFVSFGIPPDRIDLSEYGVDGAPFRRPVPRTGRTPLRLGFLGSLMVSKAPHLLLEAFGRLSAGTATVDLMGAHADYHGDTRYRHVIEPLLSLPGVRHHGLQPRENVPDALASLDALVVPSIWPEPSPFVIREALLAGLPVIASSIGGIPELVRHERNGLLFDPGDGDALHRALRRLMDEDGLLNRLRSGAAATSVRSLEDDVGASRRLYEAHVSAGNRRPRARPRLAAIVLNYRTAESTAIAVGTLLASRRPPDEVIVVDNDAGGACRDALARWSDAVAYLHTGGNLGFAGGMNAGIRRALAAGADRVVLVNSDVVLPPDCLGELESVLVASPDTGIVGPVVMSRVAPDVVRSLGIDYDRRTGRMRHRLGRAAAAVAPPDGEVTAVSGCLMLIAREVFERVGEMDERYFFGFEDIDLCLRAREAGFRTRLAGRATAYHEGGLAIGSQSPRRLYFAARNHLRLAGAHAAGASRVTRVVRAAFIIGLNIAHAVKTPGGSLPARIAATVRGIGDHLGARYGAGSADVRPP